MMDEFLSLLNLGHLTLKLVIHVPNGLMIHGSTQHHEERVICWSINSHLLLVKNWRTANSRQNSSLIVSHLFDFQSLVSRTNSMDWFLDLCIARWIWTNQTKCCSVCSKIVVSLKRLLLLRLLLLLSNLWSFCSQIVSCRVVNAVYIFPNEKFSEGLTADSILFVHTLVLFFLIPSFNIKTRIRHLFIHQKINKD